MNQSDAHICLRFKRTGGQQEVLIAHMLEFPFDGFEQTDGELAAFMPVAEWNLALGATLRDTLIAAGEDTAYSVDTIEQENWNAIWEASIEPVQAGIFLVHPSWNKGTPEQNGLIHIEIDPKMSFGTGHHESTRLALAHLASETEAAEDILDMGTGTGVLAIAAAFKEASRVVAVDNDHWCITNTRENVARNKVRDQIDIRLGSIEAAGTGPFDLILANINREVLLSMIPQFRRILNPGGRLIMAGLLESDEQKMRIALEAESFIVLDTRTEEGWWSVKAEQAG